MDHLFALHPLVWSGRSGNCCLLVPAVNDDPRRAIMREPLKPGARQATQNKRAAREAFAGLEAQLRQSAMSGAELIAAVKASIA